MDILIEAIWMVIIMFSAGYYSDEQSIITAELYQKHTVTIKPLFRIFFIFSHKGRRTRFLKIAVIAEIIAYLQFLANLILWLLIEDPGIISLVCDLNLYLVGFFAVFIDIPFSLYYKYKSYQFKKQNRRHKK